MLILNAKKNSLLILLCSILIISCRTNENIIGNTVVIKGSDTMVNLSQSWAEEFMKINDISLEQNVSLIAFFL